MRLIWVTEAKYIEEFKIKLSFNDGLSGMVDLRGKMKSLPIYKPLLNPLEFKKFSLNPWTIEWDNGADIAPESLYRLTQEQSQSKTTNIM